MVEPHTPRDREPEHVWRRGQPEFERLIKQGTLTGRIDQTVVYAECLASLDETRTLAEGLVEILSFASFVTFTNEHGLAGQTKLDELIAGARAWGDDPDALWASLQFRATLGALDLRPVDGMCVYQVCHPSPEVVEML